MSGRIGIVLESDLLRKYSIQISGNSYLILKTFYLLLLFWSQRQLRFKGVRLKDKKRNDVSEFLILSLQGDYPLFKFLLSRAFTGSETPIYDHTDEANQQDSF